MNGHTSHSQDHPDSKTSSWLPWAYWPRRVLFEGPILSSQGPTQPSSGHPASKRKSWLTWPPRTRPGLLRGPLWGTRDLRPSWKHPSVRIITRPSSTCYQAPQALGLRRRGRERHLLHLATFRSPCLGCSGKVGGDFSMWEEERIPMGCLSTTLLTNPRAGPLRSWAPPLNRDTLPEASSNPCMALTKRLPQREHSMDPREKPCALHRCFGSGSSVFWPHSSSRPLRRTPSLCQGQQREGERDTGE